MDRSSFSSHLSLGNRQGGKARKVHHSQERTKSTTKRIKDITVADPKPQSCCSTLTGSGLDFSFPTPKFPQKEP
jgi:hypothetical protein